jgi:hypothetical protein
VYKNTANNTFWEYHPTSYGGWEPILETEYNNRLTTVRDSHIGDSYIRYEIVNGVTSYEESYKFVKTDVDNTVPYNTDREGYAWAVVSDTPADAAYIEALNAYALADGKISQFYAWGGTNAPANYNITNADGNTESIPANNFDFWFSSGVLYYKPASTWVVVPNGIGTGPHLSEGDLLTVFDPTTRDYTHYNYNGTSWEQNGPTGVISKSKFFVDLDAAVNDNAIAQANFEIAVETYAKNSTGEVLSGVSAYQLGWTNDKTVTYGESDAAPIGACQTLTYADAVAFAQERGLRLPTVEEVKAGIGAGTGCSFDSGYIWTCTPGLTPGTHYTVRGSYNDPTQIVERDDTLTAPCRFVADSHDKVEGASLYAQTKLEYNAPVTVNGITQNAGFGLVNNLTNVTGAPSSGSEFWIDAQKFKFTNSGNTGVVAPFTIDASGTTPQITFNGIVNFDNVNGRITHTSGIGGPEGNPVEGSTYTETGTSPYTIWIYSDGEWSTTGNPNALVAQDLGPFGSTTINGSLITTGELNANLIKAGALKTAGLDTGTVESNYTGTIIDNNGIRVYENGTLRVKIGNI